jgi:acetylornithine deacetylase
MYGRGTSDMKGAIASYLMAAKVLHDTGVELSGDLLLAQSSGEESGQHEIGCDTVLERGWTSDLAVFPEPTNFWIFPTLKGEVFFSLIPRIGRSRRTDSL